MGPVGKRGWQMKLHIGLAVAMIIMGAMLIGSAWGDGRFGLAAAMVSTTRS